MVYTANMEMRDPNCPLSLLLRIEMIIFNKNSDVFAVVTPDELTERDMRRKQTGARYDTKLKTFVDFKNERQL